MNLVDFIESRDPGQPVRTFASAKELSDYTYNTGKVYGRTAAKRSGLLRSLLRHIAVYCDDLY